MILDWNALAAAGSFGQFIVVLVAAILALRQLEHLRRQSELQASIPFLGEIQKSAFLEGLALVVAAAGGDVELRALVERGEVADPRVGKVLHVAMFFNNMGILVEKGLIRGETIIPSYRWQIVMAWDLLLPYARKRRAGTSWAHWAPFEALAVRARAMNVENRFAEVRASLPPPLRANFDRSLAESRPAATA